jgi:hypothetical protein
VIERIADTARRSGHDGDFVGSEGGRELCLETDLAWTQQFPAPEGSKRTPIGASPDENAIDWTTPAAKR